MASVPFWEEEKAKGVQEKVNGNGGSKGSKRSKEKLSELFFALSLSLSPSVSHTQSPLPPKWNRSSWHTQHKGTEADSVNQLFSLYLSLSTLLCCSIFSDGQNAEFTHASQHSTTPLTVVLFYFDRGWKWTSKCSPNYQWNASFHGVPFVFFTAFLSLNDNNHLCVIKTFFLSNLKFLISFQDAENTTFSTSQIKLHYTCNKFESKTYQKKKKHVFTEKKEKTCQMLLASDVEGNEAIGNGIYMLTLLHVYRWKSYFIT